MAFSIGGTGGGSDQSFLRSMQQLLTRQDRTFTHLASGKRINSAADDAAGLAIAKRLEAEVQGLAAGERNVADGQDLVRTADAALQTTQDSLSRMRELAVQAGNGTLSASDRQSLQDEYDQLSAQVDQTAQGASFGGQKLLDGSASGSGAITITDGNGGSTALDVPDAGAAALGVGGLDVSDPNTFAAIDAAAARVADTRASLGAADNTFQRQQEQLAAARVDHEAARSRIEDADVAGETANRTRDGILLQLQLRGLRSAANSDQRLLDLLG